MAEDRLMNGLQCIISLPIIGGFAMSRFIDRTGHRYGRLTVVERAKNNALKKVVWKCQCDCGNTAYKTAGDLVTGNSVSCGCYLKERITKHGGWKKSSYNTWRAMMRRCYNAKDKDYKRYGGIGITVCPEWHDYLNFVADMGEPGGTQTLDRVDPYGNYTKENCRWASMPTQARNTRVRATTKSGVTGVTNVYRNKWMAKITVGKKSFYSAVYDSLEEAVAARKNLECKHWGIP